MYRTPVLDPSSHLLKPFHSPIMVEEQRAAESHSRARIVRDLLTFQVKLWLEGMKDIALVPLSLGAAVIDLLFYRKSSRGALYGVMDLGNRFEKWVDLYGARPGESGTPDLDQYEGGYPFREVSAVDTESESKSGSASSRRKER